MFNRLLVLALGALIVGFAQPSHAVIEAIGEFIYFRPSVCRLDFAVEDSRDGGPGEERTFPVGPVERIRHDYEPGFRVELGYLNCESLWNARIGYTYLRGTDRSHAAAPENGGLWILVGPPLDSSNPFISEEDFPAFACARSHIEYDALDLSVGHRSLHSGGLCVRAWAGLHYARLEHDYCVAWQGVQPIEGLPRFNSRFEQHQRVWGIGPKVGVDLRLALWCGFGVGGDFGIAVVGGDHRFNARQRELVTIDQVEGTELFDPGFSEEFHLFTQLQARLGVTYGMRWGQCFSLVLWVGYEFIDYVNALQMINFVGDQSAFNILCEDVTFDGLYVKARLEF